MSASKRPSTSSLRRFITSRPYVTVAELRRRFGLDEPDAMALLRRNGTSAWVGLPDREASKLQDLWDRNELGVELSVEVRAPVVVGVYPMRIARYVTEVPVHGNGNGVGPRPDTASQPAASRSSGANGIGGFRPRPSDNGDWRAGRREPSSEQRHAPRPMSGAPSYGNTLPQSAPPEDSGRS
jgi:hypothetical protein